MDRREALKVLALSSALTKITLDKCSAQSTGPDLFRPSGAETIRPSDRVVIAHWHSFPISIDNKDPRHDYYNEQYMRPEGENSKFRYAGGFIRERPLSRPVINDRDWRIRDMITDIELASSIGIDCFQFNLNDLNRKGGSWAHLENMLAAAELHGSNFKIMICVDCVSISSSQAEEHLVDAFIFLAQHKSIYIDSLNDSIVLSAFLADRWPASTWQTILDQIRASNLRAVLFSIFLDISGDNNQTAILNMATYVSVWTGNHRESLNYIDKVATTIEATGKHWVSPIWPQDFRPKSGFFVESLNSALFREAWERAISANYRFVEILTWNDYSEGSEIRPSSSIQYSFYDLAAYYIQRFKSRSQPIIANDALYYFHRVNLVDGMTVLLKQEKAFRTPFGPSPVNEIEAVAFLTQPGRIEIDMNGVITGENLPAGVSAIRAAARIGKPYFRLMRNGRTEIELASNFEIVSQTDYQDLLYHGGSSTRKPPDN